MVGEITKRYNRFESELNIYMDGMFKVQLLRQPF